MKGIQFGQDWDGTRNGLFTQKAHNGNHGQSSIVEFTVLLALHNFRTNTTRVHLGPNQFRRGSTHHVMRLLQFLITFGNKNGSNNLPLACAYPKTKYRYTEIVQMRERLKEQCDQSSKIGIDFVFGQHTLAQRLRKKKTKIHELSQQGIFFFTNKKFPSFLSTP